MTLKPLLRLAAAVVVVTIVPACDQFPGFFNPFPQNTVTAVLRGSQAVPAVTTAAAGTATLTVDALQESIAFTVAETGLGTVTAVTVRAGAAGTNGPVMFTLA